MSILLDMQRRFQTSRGALATFLASSLDLNCFIYLLTADCFLCKPASNRHSDLRLPRPENSNQTCRGSMLSSMSSHVLAAQGFALHAQRRRACVLPSTRRCLVHDPAFSSHGHTSFVSARRCRPARNQTLRRAAPQDASGSDTSGDFDLSLYVEAKVERGKANVLYLLPSAQAGLF